MHNYMRAIGFKSIKNRKQVLPILNDIKENWGFRDVVQEEDMVFTEMIKEFGPSMGISVCGEVDEEGFHQDYYFPYFKGEGITSEEDLIIEKHIGKESFAGVCEDVRVGVSMIFYLQNCAEYRRQALLNRLNSQHITTTFSGLSVKGSVLLPIQKSEDQIDSDREAAQNRSHLIAAARNGDEDAIESLTLEDIDIYSMISRRISNEDVFSIVDNYFMPYGMECDQYNVMGEIISYQKVKNTYTDEEVFHLKILCSDIILTICIHTEDLLGIPQEGRRFKGVIWLQGRLNFPEI